MDVEHYSHVMQGGVEAHEDVPPVHGHCVGSHGEASGDSPIGVSDAEVEHGQAVVVGHNHLGIGQGEVGRVGDDHD